MDIKRLPACILKWIGRILLSILILIFLLVVAVYLPPVQQWLKNWACDYLSEETGMKVEIDHVSLTPWLDLQLERRDQLLRHHAYCTGRVGQRHLHAKR